MDFPLFAASTGNGQNNQLGEENVGHAQFGGVPLSAASFNAMMAGGQLPSTAGAANFPPSALAAAQYSATAAGMFPSAAAVATNAAIFGGHHPHGPNGHPPLHGFSSGNGLALPTSALALGTAPKSMVPMAAATAPFLLTTANGASAGGAAAAMCGASALYPHANDAAAAATGGDATGTDPQTAAAMAVPKGLPAALLSRYWSLQPTLPSCGGDDPSERPYRDHAMLTESESVRRFGAKESRGGGTNFPSKLHEILSRTDISDIISWSPHGRSWRVFKPKAFEEKVIPQYFRHSKYNSFTRQVNGWGFRRITQGPDHNAYFHEMFLRGLPHLCKRMRRLTASGTSRADAAASVEPDFYSISKVSPLPVVQVPTSSAPASSVPETRADKDDPNTRDDEGAKTMTTTTATTSCAKTHTDNAGRVVRATTTAAAAARSKESDSSAAAAAAAASAAVAAAHHHPAYASPATMNDLARQQFLQAQYLNAVSAAPSLFRQDAHPPRARLEDQHGLQQQILAQQALLSSLQSQQAGALSPFAAMPTLPPSQMYAMPTAAAPMAMPGTTTTPTNMLNNAAPGTNMPFY